MTEAKNEAKTYPVGDLIYPPKHSLSPAYNAYYVFCDVHGQQRSFSVCGHIVLAVEEDRLTPDQFTDCQRAILRNDCPAKAMRAEEIEADRALYFVERKRPEPPVKESTMEDLLAPAKRIDKTSESYLRGRAQVSSGEGIKKGPVSPVTSNKGGGRSTVSRPTPKTQASAPEVGTIDYGALASKIAKQEASEKASKPTTEIAPEPGESAIQFARRHHQARRGA